MQTERGEGLAFRSGVHAPALHAEGSLDTGLRRSPEKPAARKEPGNSSLGQLECRQDLQPGRNRGGHRQKGRPGGAEQNFARLCPSQSLRGKEESLRTKGRSLHLSPASLPRRSRLAGRSGGRTVLLRLPPLLRKSLFSVDGKAKRRVCRGVVMANLNPDRRRRCPPPPGSLSGMAPGLLVWLLLLLGASGAEEPSPACPPQAEPEPEPEPPFDAQYAAGVEAHLRGDFAGAVRCLERALSAHRRLRETRLSCGLRCRREAPLPARPGEDAALFGQRDLPFAAAVLRRARCLRSCRQDAGLGPDSRHIASEEVRADFQRRVPYSYLQRAYIQFVLHALWEQLCLSVREQRLAEWHLSGSGEAVSVSLCPCASASPRAVTGQARLATSCANRDCRLCSNRGKKMQESDMKESCVLCFGK
ncbi:hypothetical protein lerEdw1_005078 [Lerista edwardsae]|nr:hypothetical protein lerEdw1_005078 [Lerista edwardsae]